MNNVIKRLEIIISGGALVAAIGATFLNVICRYFLNRPIYQAEEIATSMFVWLVFVGASACYGENMHIGIDCFVNLLPPGMRRAVKVLTDGALIVINLVMAWLAVDITISARLKLTSALRVSYSFIDAAAALAFILMAFHAVRFFIEDIHPPKTEKGGEA